MISFCGIELAHPVINASGTFDAIAARRAFGDALLEHFPFAAFVSKTVTVAPRQGNPPPRLWELPAGLMNSIGLPNKGLEGYLAHDLPELARLPVPLIVNVMGFSRDEVARLVTAFAQRDEVAALELNVSCPNVETGLVMGADPDEVARLMSAVRPLTDKPLIVKLTPNASDVPAVAMRRRAGGGERRLAHQHDPRDGRAPTNRASRGWGGRPAGYRGPRCARSRWLRYGRWPRRWTSRSSGWAGSRTAATPHDLIAAGATLVAVGTESFRDPSAGRADRRRVSARSRGAPPFRAGAGGGPALIRTTPVIESKNPLQTKAEIRN